MNPASAALDWVRRRSGYRLALTVAGLISLLGATVAVTTLGRRAQSAPAGAR